MTVFLQTILANVALSAVLAGIGPASWWAFSRARNAGGREWLSVHNS
jgi:hypothetical protein